MAKPISSFVIKKCATYVYRVSTAATLCLLLLVFTAIHCLAQDRIGFESFTTDDGMSRNRITCFEQDKQGYIWLGPQTNGLMRFDGYRFKTFRYNANDSNSIQNENIYALHCDRLGNMWIATNKGLQYYDPLTGYFNYPSKKFNTPRALDSTSVFTINEDASGTLWFVTERDGLFSLNINSRKSAQYFKNDPLGAKLITATRDKSGMLWIMSNLCLLRINSRGKIIKVPFADSSLLNSFAVFNQEIAVADDGEVWLEMGDGSVGLFEITDKATMLRRMNVSYQGDASGSGKVISLLTDSKGFLWIGTFGGGLCRYDKRTDSMLVLKHNDGDKSSIPGDFVKTIFEDRQGIIWIGTYGSGAAKYDPDNHRFALVKKRYDDQNSLTGNDVTSAYAINRTELLISSRSNGFTYWNRSTRKFTHYKVDDHHRSGSLPSNIVYDFSEDSLGNTWVCAVGALCRYDRKASPHTAFTLFAPPKEPGREILFFAIPIFDKHHLLVSSVAGLHVFNTATKQWSGLPDRNQLQEKYQHISTRAWARDGKVLWLPLEFPTLTAIMSKYDPEKKILTPVSAKYKNRFLVVLKGIAVDSNGTHLWLATHEGLALFNKKTFLVEKLYTTNDGLADNLCVSVLLNNKNELWIGTNGGLCRFDIAAQKFTTFNRKYGIQGDEFNNNIAQKISADELLFGGINGINIFKPAELKANAYSPDVTITGLRFTAKNKDIHIAPGADIKLNPDQNFFTIEFAALNFSRTSLTRYEYILNDVDKDWISSGKVPYATYTNLAPGSYFFQVRAVNSDGIATKNTTTFHFTITPPFYRTWWFLMALVVLLTTGVYLLVKRRITLARRQEQQKTELEKLASEQYRSQLEIAKVHQQLRAAELDALRSQMNPHFIFNSLNSIENYILKNDRLAASAYLGKFSKLVRRILDSSKKELVSLEQEIETIRIYIELEQLRMNGQFSCIYEIDTDLQLYDIQIPPMLIQPYVENAILHGLRYRTDNKGVLKIKMFVSGQLFYYVVEDNGIGRTKSAEFRSGNGHQSYGTAITQSRIDSYNQLNNTAIAVKITDLYNSIHQSSGTRVEVVFPV